MWSGSVSPPRRQAILAQQVGNRDMEIAETRPAFGVRWGRPRGLPTDVVVSIVLSGMLAIMVAFAGQAMTITSAPFAETAFLPSSDAPSEDLDPRDSLVRCTVLVTHMHCIREQS
jgi:hypothetical protein